MTPAQKHRLKFSAFTAMMLIVIVTPMIVREPSSGHIIFGIGVLVVGTSIVYMVGAVADSMRKKR